MSSYEGLQQITEQVNGPDTDWSKGDKPEDVVLETKEVFTSFAQGKEGSGQNEIIISDPRKVGQKLAMVSDQIYSDLCAKFDEIANSYGESSLYSYETFNEFAGNIFKNGVNWGRIVGVLSFGYWLLERVIGKQGQEKKSSLMLEIAENITKYFRDAAPGIALWIAKKGGWRMAMYVVFKQITGPVLSGIAVGFVAGAIIGVAATLMIAQKFTR